MKVALNTDLPRDEISLQHPRLHGVPLLRSYQILKLCLFYVTSGGAHTFLF